mmetsp:Transcript_64668/g.140841  ORF Transcript_64668/g.140841 Transcript_64668/m.140841 type:complete len:1198 (-) Transcript_64668:69-3662(-)
MSQSVTVDDQELEFLERMDTGNASSVGGGAESPEMNDKPLVASLHEEMKLQGSILDKLSQGQNMLAEAFANIGGAKSLHKFSGTFSLDDGESVESERVDTDLDYTDAWPSVEVTVSMNEVLRFDLQELTFDADFGISLDWIDPKLIRGVHYQYSAEQGKFELMRILRNVDDDLHFFNPSIFIDNGKSEPEAVDCLPQIVDEIFSDGRDDVPWLTKRFRFLGTLSCRHVNAKYFPFDVEGLNIRISSHDMRGVTSLGMPRRVTLLEPQLRKALRMRQRKLGLHRGWHWAVQTDEAMSHCWREPDDGGDSLGVGEMQVLAVGGMASQEGESYIYYIVLRRRWYPRYVMDFVLNILQVVVAMFSFWVPFTDDMLSNRMSITLTVMLTLVAAASTRPPVIDSLPYPTLHDHYGQFVAFCVVLIGVGNWLVFVNCWGMYREEGEDNIFDKDLWMVVENEKPSILPGMEDLCQLGWCVSSQFDCTILLLMTVLLLISIVALFVTAQMHRITTLLRIKHQVDAPDCHPGKYSRLVLCHTGFELVLRPDVLSWAIHAAVLPYPKLFWRVWCCFRQLRLNAFRLCGCCRMTPRRPVTDRPFHAIDAQELLLEATQRMKETKDNLPQISRFHVKLSPFEVFRVLDVGSGELGFYSYWLDQQSRCVRADGIVDKLKYKKNHTFVDQFMSESDGARQLSRHILVRFGICSEADLVDVQEVLDSPKAGRVSVHSEAAKLTALHIPGAPERDSSTEKIDGTIGTRCASSPMAPEKEKSGTGHARKKLLMCLTGANRQMLRDDASGRARLQDFIRNVNDRLEKFGLECVAYSPEDVDEAMYELWATEWVVQHGDLDVSSMKLQKAYRTLKNGHSAARVTWEEVLREFADLRAEDDLVEAYRKAGKGHPSVKVRRKSSRSLTTAEEFSEMDLDNNGVITREEFETAHTQAIPMSVICSNFYACFEANPPLLRALLRARLFSGTLSAGSGSSQVTLRCASSLETSQVHSLPLGNRTPLVSMTLTRGHEDALFSKRMPATREIARELLCGQAVTGRDRDQPLPKETKAAWSEDGPVPERRLELWEQLVERCAEERGLPYEQRGLYVGISAVYYAAKLAKCDGLILERDIFLAHLEKRRDELVKEGSLEGRGLTNLTLVIVLVRFVLHKTALIVCKRTWTVGEGGVTQADFLATWTLGLYLKHSGVMGVPLRILGS